MTEQLDLLPKKAPRISSEDVALLIRVLAGHDWMSAAEVVSTDEFQGRFWGLKKANAERRIRAIANSSDGHVLSYPGSPGYRLTIEAKIEEIQTAVSKLRHQARQMTERALQIDRVYHGKKGPCKVPESPADGPKAFRDAATYR